MNKYLKLIEVASPYNMRITRLRNRIFGDVVRKTNKKSMKTVELFRQEPVYMKDEVVNYYPRYNETSQLMQKLRNYGLYRDEYEDFKDEMKSLRRLRGKVKPKKGEGKQVLNK